MAMTTLFLDMNAFFASVEQQLQPRYRHRPVGIVPVTAGSTCCIAVSYEARNYGVRTGTMVAEARRLCPGIELVEARPEVYVRIHERITKAVAECVPIHQVHSIDEMTCRLLRNERSPEVAVGIAQKIKRRLRDTIGPYIRCSVGIGPNYLLAKVAANLQKPDGLSTLQCRDLPHKIKHLDLDDFPGISRNMKRRLAQSGVTSVEQMYGLSIDRMERVWGGIVGRRWWHWLHGRDVDLPPIQRRMFGHARVLPPEYRTYDGAEAVMHHLIHKAATRLRDMHYWARKMIAFASCSGQRYWTMEVSLGQCRDTLTLIEVFRKHWPRSLPGRPLKIGVTLTSLVHDVSATLPLFEEDRKRVQLSDTMDAINTRFGARTVYFGGMHPANRAVPTRIAFTQIPGLDHFRRQKIDNDITEILTHARTSTGDEEDENLDK